ncbi:CYCS [Cordylochernes scorpioides]|uniref:CYCS n=1 Tax=Cordylochernes scorpioides TaxID=51811 RepID=A0ABY6K0K3_9ARAC|nr:CYCS [Cordylochernes scorpioides]
MDFKNCAISRSIQTKNGVWRLKQNVDMSVPAGDSAKGKKIFTTKCAQCHNIEAGKGHKTGPSLWDIVGKKTGQGAGYKYSDANKNCGLTWTKETLYKYLENPKKMIPGTKMVFAGIKKPQERADLVAYIESMGEPK